MKYFGTISDPKDLVNKEYIDDGLEVKANVDGAYEDMTVGNAEQLVSTVFVNDQVPYTYRTSGGSADIGDREYDQLVGGTVAWNQLVKNGDFEDTSNWAPGRCTRSVTDNVCTLSSDGTASFMQIYQDISIPINHVMFVRYNYDFSNSLSVNRTFLTYTDLSSYFSVGTNTTTSGTNTFVFKSTFDISRVQFVFYGSSDNLTQGETADFSKINIIDLTQLFGSAIADYIYTLETTNPGDGVAWVTKLFPQLNGGYYPYNAGELLSVSGVSAHNMTGLNQFDGSLIKNRSVNSSGEVIYNPNTAVSENLIKVFPGTKYCFHVEETPVTINALVVHQYDAGMNYISYQMFTQDVPLVIKPNAAYAYLQLNASSEIDVTRVKLCFNLSWDGEMDGTYEPYKLNSYPLDSSLTLRGVPKLDANNALYYDGDTYEADGMVTRRYGIVDLGTLSWSNAGSSTGSPAGWSQTGVIPEIKPVSASSKVANIICKKYATASANAVFNGTDMSIAINNDARVQMCDSGFAGYTGSQIATALSGVYLVYELATPTTEEATPYQSPQIVNDFGTEEYVTTAQSGVLVPVGHNTNYANNLRAKLEMAPESPSGDGDYIVRQTSGQNSYVPLTFPISDLPAFPTTDGTYTLQVVVSDGTGTASWVSA